MLLHCSARHLILVLVAIGGRVELVNVSPQQHVAAQFR